jgi:hypothetical protein
MAIFPTIDQDRFFRDPPPCALARRQHTKGALWDFPRWRLSYNSE